MVQDRKRFERLVGWRSLSPEGLAALKSELAAERQQAELRQDEALRLATEGTLLGATDICVRGNLPLEGLCVLGNPYWATSAGVFKGEESALMKEAWRQYGRTFCTEAHYHQSNSGIIAVVLFESEDEAMRRIGIPLRCVVVGYWRLKGDYLAEGGSFYRLWLVPHQTQERWLLETPR